MSFNPFADIIAAEDTSPRYQIPKGNKNLKVNVLSKKKDDSIMPMVKKRVKI